MMQFSQLQPAPITYRHLVQQWRKAQSRYHHENKGPGNDFFSHQSRYRTEKKATYQKPWELPKSMTKSPLK
jgi:hypothetical protein